MKISVILGTRPELIKLAPVIRQGRRKGHDICLISTGQHREMLRSLYEFFDLSPDVDLDVMAHDQSLGGLSERILHGLGQSAGFARPDHVVVQGDTTSAFVGAYWAFLNRIPVSHVEAGLRTNDLDGPFPEEANRQLISRIASHHFAPTLAAATTLRAERLPRPSIHVVGNTGIDALLQALHRISHAEIPAEHRLDPELVSFAGDEPLVLVTAHRRENHGDGIRRICAGIERLLALHPTCRVIYPVHPNPNIRRPVEAHLGAEARVRLCAPFAYGQFVQMMSRADLILTDSGGVQEEAPSLGKPILVLREETERPEGVEAGFSTLVGTDPDRIARLGAELLQNRPAFKAENPYGDGHAAERIIEVLEAATECGSMEGVAA